jgi:hypothetical protein
MSDKRDGSTKQLIAEGESLRGEQKKGGKAPSTRTLVREAEQLIGRQPKGVAPGVKKLLLFALALSLAACAVAAIFLFWA